MKNALTNLIKSIGSFIWEVLKIIFTFINGRLVQDTVIPITYGALTMEAYKHDAWMVVPLILLFIATMTRNVNCSIHEDWRRKHPQTRDELNASIDRALEDTPLPGVTPIKRTYSFENPKGS